MGLTQVSCAPNPQENSHPVSALPKKIWPPANCMHSHIFNTHQVHRIDPRPFSAAMTRGHSRNRGKNCTPLHHSKNFIACPELAASLPGRIDIFLGDGLRRIAAPRSANQRQDTAHNVRHTSHNSTKTTPDKSKGVYKPQIHDILGKFPR